MENLNAEQIKKALECCVKAETHLDCRKLKCPALINDECIYIGETDEDCDRQQLADALALITSQEQEKEKLGLLIDEIETEKRKLFEENKRLTEEKERLLTALANYDRLTDVRIAEEYYTAEAYEELREENENLRTESDRLKARTLEALTEFAESVKRYYSALPGATVGAAVRFYVDEKLKEALDKI